jgi:hypothetical protein
MADNRDKIHFSGKLKKIITAYAFKKGISKPDAVRQAVQGLFDDIPKISETELLATYDKMTPEERKHPNK